MKFHLLETEKRNGRVEPSYPRSIELQIISSIYKKLTCTFPSISSMDPVSEEETGRNQGKVKVNGFDV